MRQKLYTMFFCVFSLAFVATDCKHNPVGPEIIQPGRRDYTWTFDTLHLQQGYLETIWGSSPTDIWAGGYDDLFHYDGIKWARWNGYTGWSNRALYGLSQNDIWLSGDGAQLWHYDGTTWTQKFTYKPDSCIQANVMYLQGSNSTNIYAVGYIMYGNDNRNWYGFILHYNGSDWSETYRADHASEFGKIKIDNSNPYVLEYKLSPTHYMGDDSISFYQLINNRTVKLLYTNCLDSIGGSGMINTIGNQVYFIISHDVYKYEYINDVTGRFVKCFSFPEQDFGNSVYGRNEKDIFVRLNSGLSHYNGTDVQTLIQFSNSLTGINFEPTIFDNDVFFCVSDDENGINMILHGKLKQ